MSTREMAYELIESMSEEQLLELLRIFGKKSNTEKARSVRGIFSKVADSSKLPLEKSAWEMEAAEKYSGSFKEIY